MLIKASMRIKQVEKIKRMAEERRAYPITLHKVSNHLAPFVSQPRNVCSCNRRQALKWQACMAESVCGQRCLQIGSCHFLHRQQALQRTMASRKGPQDSFRPGPPECGRHPSQRRRAACHSRPQNAPHRLRVGQGSRHLRRARQPLRPPQQHNRRLQ